jgi:hypothetical protein
LIDWDDDIAQWEEGRPTRFAGEDEMDDEADLPAVADRMFIPTTPPAGVAGVGLPDDFILGTTGEPDPNGEAAAGDDQQVEVSVGYTEMRDKLIDHFSYMFVNNMLRWNGKLYRTYASST